MTLKELNTLSKKETVENLMLCCGSTKWADKMTAERPFSTKEELLKKAESIWKNEMDESDWREAFTHHPKIGDIDSLREKYASTKKWAEGEQKGASEASEDVLKKLAEYNQTYEDKFGYIFIVCATGKSAAEMLSILEDRLENDPKEELLIAADEQRKITEIRLEKLLN